MKIRIFILLMWAVLCVETSLHFVSAQEPELDLQTLIAGIKHFDGVILSGKGTFLLNGRMVQGKKETYEFTFDGVTFEESQVRADFPAGPISTEIWDGERQWEIYRSQKLLFYVDISAEDYANLKKVPPKIPRIVKEQLKVHKINISDDFRIETDEGDPNSGIIIDNVTEHLHHIYYTEKKFGYYTTFPAYSLRPQCIISPQLDPRYWTTYAALVPNEYLMIPLWKLLETYEIETFQTETLNDKKTYRIRVKYPHSESLTLWVSPEQGFRLVKLQRITKLSNIEGGSIEKKWKYYLIERILHYKEYQSDLWFPEKVDQARYRLLTTNPQTRDKPILKWTLQVIKNEINTDVSASFQLDVPDDTLIYDYGSAKEHTFGELKNPKK